LTRHGRLFAVGSVAIGAALFAALSGPFKGWFGPSAEASLAYGIAVCLGVVAVSFLLLRRALASSSRFFQIAFVGGILGRLFLFAIAIGIAFVVSGLDGRSAAVALAAAFFPLTALELYCVLAGRASGGVERRRRE